GFCEAWRERCRFASTGIWGGTQCRPTGIESECRRKLGLDGVSPHRGLICAAVADQPLQGFLTAGGGWGLICAPKGVGWFSMNKLSALFLALSGILLSWGAAAVPANDSFSNAIQVSGTNVDFSGTFGDATLEPGEPHPYATNT